jgi:hypothetical protein
MTDEGVAQTSRAVMQDRPSPVPTESLSRLRCAGESDMNSIVILGRRPRALTWLRSNAAAGVSLHSEQCSRLEKNTAFRMALFLSTKESNWPVNRPKTHDLGTRDLCRRCLLRFFEVSVRRN